MMKKMLARAGIGSAKAQLELLRASYRNGEAVTGYVRVIGGEAVQYVEKVSVRVKQRNSSFPLAAADRAEIELAYDFVMEKGSERHFPFMYTVNADLDEEGVPVIFEFVTVLHMKRAIKDRHTIEVLVQP